MSDPRGVDGSGRSETVMENEENPDFLAYVRTTAIKRLEA
jgi:hypothetical protein